MELGSTWRWPQYAVGGAHSYSVRCHGNSKIVHAYQARVYVYMCAYTYISHEEGFCLQVTEHPTPEA